MNDLACFLLTLLTDEVNFYICGKSTNYHSYYNMYKDRYDVLLCVCKRNNVDLVGLLMYMIHYRLFKIKMKKIKRPEPNPINFDKSELQHYVKLYKNYRDKHSVIQYADFNDINIRFITNIFNGIYLNENNIEEIKNIKNKVYNLFLGGYKINKDKLDDIVYCIRVLGLENVNTNLLFTTNILDGLTTDEFNSLSRKKNLPNDYHVVYNILRDIYQNKLRRGKVD